MAAHSRISICNEAIAELPAKVIASLDENSLEARECSRFYPEVVSELLEGPYDWSFQNRRVVLAALTNSRDQEWLYAYAVPSDMASPIRVIPDLEAAGLGYPVPLPGAPYAETWALTGRYFETPYVIENSVLYTNVESATLEYTINDVSEISIPKLAKRAIVLELAGRLAMPIKKDQALKERLLGQAEMARQVAIADDQNRHPQSHGGYVSEAMLARGGYFPGGC